MRQLAFHLSMTAVIGLAMSSMAAAARIDLNGEMVNANNSAGFPSPDLPLNWTTYLTGLGGGMAGRWDTGGSSNTFNTKWADEDPERALVNGGVKVGNYPAGHSMLFGGQTSVVTAGTYGILQTYSATAGKVYWISGAEGASGDWNTNQVNKYAFDYGVETGTGVTNGQISTGNIRRSGGGLQDGRFSHAVVATGSQITAHVGMRSNTANNNDINVFVDGVRVYELDAPFNGSLQNGGFEGSSTDISNYQAKDVGAIGPVNAQNDLLDSWIPLGGSAGQRAKYNQDNVIKNSGTFSFQFDMNKGNGRMFAVQRVKLGGAGTAYSLSGMVRGETADSNAMIGIDPNGGLDPLSASIVWSSAAPLLSFGALSANVIDALGNGVSVFLASGKYTLGQNVRTGGDYGARFDDIVLTPEPATIGLLAIGGLFLLRRGRRA